MNAIAAFHFLHPEWLWLLLPSIAVLWPMWRRRDPARALKAVIDPLLLRHLELRDDAEEGRLRPVYLLAAAWLLAVIALAGPAWKKEPTPFGEDRSALFVVIEVTPTMLARDVQPSRLERAVQKTGDLLERRAGTQTGLIAFAGTPHLVMPLTRDAEVIRYFAGALGPNVMPEAGDDPVPAVELAAQRLQQSGMAGSILLVTDGVDAAVLAGLEAVHETYGFAVDVYAVAAGPDVTPPPDSPSAPFLDRRSLEAAADAGGGALVTVTPDDRDLDRLEVRVARSIESAPAGEGQRWQDFGYALLWPLLLVILLFWRRGGGVDAGGGT
jgi:Ca-activated chloride channel family protein